jgi:hypothetical protein
MAKHLGVRRRWNVFEYRYHQRRLIAVWIKIRRLIKARLNHG